MKKITFKNIFGILLLALILYQVYKYTNEYLTIKNYQYGEKYNYFRLKNGIPIINADMEPFKMPVDNFWGMMWINERETKTEKPLIHRIKTINASEKTGWKSENDSFLYFINDTTNYILSIDSEKSNSLINHKYKLTKTDSRKKDFEDYKENKFETYSERKLNKSTADSIMNKWKIK
jgi:hypothetical protein